MILNDWFCNEIPLNFIFNRVCLKIRWFYKIGHYHCHIFIEIPFFNILFGKIIHCKALINNVLVKKYSFYS